MATSSSTRPTVLALTALALFLVLCLGPSKRGEWQGAGEADRCCSGGIGTHFESRQGPRVIVVVGFALAGVASNALGQANRVPGSRAGSPTCLITLGENEDRRSERGARSVSGLSNAGRGNGSLNQVGHTSLFPAPIPRPQTEGIQKHIIPEILFQELPSWVKSR